MLSPDGQLPSGPLKGIYTAATTFLASRAWLPWAVLSAVFAAMTAITAKIGLEGVGSEFATLIRVVVIFFVLEEFVVRTGKWQDPWALSGKTWLFLVLSALATGGSWVCYYRALKIGEASRVAPVDKLSVVLVAIFAFLFLKERPSWVEWCGIGLVGAGVVVLAWGAEFRR